MYMRARADIHGPEGDPLWAAIGDRIQVLDAATNSYNSYINAAGVWWFVYSSELRPETQEEALEELLKGDW